MTHPIGSPYARDQISQRASLLNEKRLQPEGEYVLYWMQSTQRLEDNWATRRSKRTAAVSRCSSIMRSTRRIRMRPTGFTRS